MCFLARLRTSLDKCPKCLWTVSKLTVLARWVLEYYIVKSSMSQLCYGPVVTYCMVYYYTKRATLTRLLANEGPAIYVVYLNRYFVIPPWYYLVVTFLWHSICNTKIVLSRNLSTKVINSVPSEVLILTNPLSSVTINPPWRKAPRDSSQQVRSLQ